MLCCSSSNASRRIALTKFPCSTILFLNSSLNPLLYYWKISDDNPLSKNIYKCQSCSHQTNYWLVNQRKSETKVTLILAQHRSEIKYHITSQLVSSVANRPLVDTSFLAKVHSVFLEDHASITTMRWLDLIIILMSTRAISVLSSLTSSEFSVFSMHAHSKNSLQMKLEVLWMPTLNLGTLVDDNIVVFRRFNGGRRIMYFPCVFHLKTIHFSGVVEYLLKLKVYHLRKFNFWLYKNN